MNILNISLIIIATIVIGLGLFFNQKRKEQQHAERRWMDGGLRENQEDIIVGDIDDDYFGDEVGEARIVEPSNPSESMTVNDVFAEEPIEKEALLVTPYDDSKEGEQQEMDFADFAREEAKEELVEPKPELLQSIHETMVVLTVMAPDDDMFEGADLLREFTSQNLVLGKDGFYHRPVPGLTNEYLFSVANVMEPGTLHTSDIIQLTTKGLLLFMRLPNKLTPVQAFEQFYDAADGLAVTLGGEVCNQQRNMLGEYRLEQMRDDMQHLALKLDVEAKQK